MGKKQDESLKYMGGNYSNIWRLPGEFWEDVQQASEMMDAEEYVITELVVWYQLEIKKMEELANGQQVQRNSQSRPRHGESSRIQPKKECGTRQEN